jgi:hypothetical protein
MERLKYSRSKKVDNSVCLTTFTAFVPLSTTPYSLYCANGIVGNWEPDYYVNMALSTHDVNINVVYIGTNMVSSFWIKSLQSEILALQSPQSNTFPSLLYCISSLSKQSRILYSSRRVFKDVVGGS